jgi:hypothetical protein
LPLPRLPVLMSEAINRIRALVCVLAWLVPVPTSFLRVARSCEFSLICGAVFILHSTTFHIPPFLYGHYFVGALLSMTMRAGLAIFLPTLIQTILFLRDLLTFVCFVIKTPSGEHSLGSRSRRVGL